MNHSSRYSVVGLYARALPKPQSIPCVTIKCQTAVLEADMMRLVLEIRSPTMAAVRLHRDRRRENSVDRKGREM